MNCSFIYKKALAQCFCILATLNKLLFQYYVSESDEAKSVIRLKKINQKRVQFFKNITHTRRLSLPQPYNQIFTLLENVYELIFALHLFRFRIKDPHILSMCARELSTIEKTSTHELNNIALGLFYSKFIKQNDNLLEAIQSLESLFQHTLKVVLPAPAVFMMFIQDFYTLQEKLNLTKNILCHKYFQLPDERNN